MTRRSFCMSVAILFCGTSLALAAENKNVLFLTKSQGFQHSVITRDWKDPAKPAHAERLLTEFGGANGFTVTVTKDADVFNDPETYKKYDVFAFYTTGDLTAPSDKYDVKRDDKGQPVKGPDGKPMRGNMLHTEKPMSKEGKAMFLKSIQDGKGFIAFHCGSDTFHKGPNSEMVRPNGKYEVDPYIEMV